jgi:hypothetical protein
LHLRLEWRQEKADGEQVVSAVLRNQGASVANAKITFTQQGNKMLSKTVELASGDKAMQNLVTTAVTRTSKQEIIAKAIVEWQGQLIELIDEQGARVYPWSSMAIVDDVKVSGKEVSITSEFRGPHAGTTKGKIMVQAYPSDSYETSYFEEEVTMAPYEIRQFTNKFTLKSDVVAKPTAIDVTFELVIDGEPVLLTQRSAIN